MECRIINKSFRKFGFTIVIGILITFNGCYYDIEEELYPQVFECDTINVTYSGTISTIMEINCNSCHSGASPQAGIKTNNYTDLFTIASNGQLWGSVNHETGFPPMPQNAPKLSDCNLWKIKVWIDNGVLDN